MLGPSIRGITRAQPHGGHQAPEAEQARVRSEAELVEIWLAAGDNDFGRIVKLLMLTGQRRQEFGSREWSETITSRGKPKGGVAGIYNQATYLAEMRQALEQWAAHCSRPRLPRTTPR